jgi:hypothetical protein
MAVAMKMNVFWDVTKFGLVYRFSLKKFLPSWAVQANRVRDMLEGR